MPPNRKSITNQKINSIKIHKLKCINELNEIFFSPHPLTAILGPNGSGKSTILHALASIYMPEEGFRGEDNKLGDFSHEAHRQNGTEAASISIYHIAAVPN